MAAHRGFGAMAHRCDRPGAEPPPTLAAGDGRCGASPSARSSPSWTSRSRGWRGRCTTMPTRSPRSRVTVALGAVVFRFAGRARPVWALIWLAQCLSGLAVVVVEIVDATRGSDPVPGWAHTQHLLAHPVQILALLLLVKRRGQGDRAAWLDAALLALTAYAAVWGLVLDLVPSQKAGPLAVFMGPFPTVAGIVIVAVMLRVVLVTGRDGALLLLLAAVLAAAAADIGNNIAARTIPLQLDGWVNAMWMAGFTLTLAAALHPRASRITNEQPPDAGGLGTLRIVALTIGALLIPSLLRAGHQPAVDDEVHGMGVDERRGHGDRARSALAGGAGTTDADPLSGGSGQDRCPHRAGEPADVGVPGRPHGEGADRRAAHHPRPGDGGSGLLQGLQRRSWSPIRRRHAPPVRDGLAGDAPNGIVPGAIRGRRVRPDHAGRLNVRCRRTARRTPAGHARADDRLDRRDGVAGRRIAGIRRRAGRSGVVCRQESRS